jgi:hypothetical protein
LANFLRRGRPAPTLLTMRSSARTLVLLGALVLTAGCGQESAGPSAGDDPSVLPPPTPTAPPSDYVAPIQTMGADGLQDASPKALSVPAFERVMASYCTDYYTSQRDNQEQNHGPNQQSRIDFARTSSADARRTERQLVNLEPPVELATAFDQFLDITHRISEDRATMLASIRAVGRDGWAGDDVEDALMERRELATRLHAPLCDGKLPAAQEEGAVAVARAWATTSDPAEACQGLVTPGYLSSPEAEASCEHSRTMANTPPYQLPDDIEVVEVTGVEELTATVSYLKVGGCYCTLDGTLRLFFLDGQWRVNQSADLESSQLIPVDN